MGLIVPPTTKIAPVLSPVAALCLGAIMVGATVVHMRRKETPAPTIVLTLVAIASAILGFATL